MRIVVRVKQNVDLGMVRGACGIVDQILFAPMCTLVDGEDGRTYASEPPLAVRIRLESGSTKCYAGENEDIRYLFPVSESYSVHFTNAVSPTLSGGSHTVHVTGIPFIHGFASTDISVQGQTREGVFVVPQGAHGNTSLRRKTYYVVISRAKSRDGVVFLRALSAQELNQNGPGADDLEEEERILRAWTDSRDALARAIQSVPELRYTRGRFELGDETGAIGTRESDGDRDVLNGSANGAKRARRGQAGVGGVVRES